MAAKHRSKKTKQQTGPRGLRGRTGPAGPVGPPGPASSGEIRKLAAQVNEVVRELQVQLTRIAQIQAQLDRLSGGQASEPRNRRATDRF